jgi:ankyrin repeat protein
MRKSKEFWDAAVSGNIELMRTLSLDPEVDINWKDASGHTAFHQACVEGNEEVVRYLLDFNQKAVDYNSGLGSTPLLSACFYGHNRVFEMLVGDERIDLNKGNPLCMSSMHGNLEAVKFLLASGRQIDTTKRDQIRNMTAAELARKSGRIQIAELLEAYEKDPLETRERLRKELGYSGKKNTLHSHLSFLKSPSLFRE